MAARSHPTTTPVKLAALTLLVALASALGCASGGCNRDDFKGVGCRAAAARENLSFGLSREEAIDVIGRSEVEPPWSNNLGLGPAVISNPFDSETLESPIGEEYEVVRFFVEADGNPDCPFIQGNLRLEPLIFVNDELVGWRWSYLSDVLGKRININARTWNFGAFCGGTRPGSPEADTPDTEPAEPDATPPAETSDSNVDP
jgi:hypothetical protein